MLEMRTAVILKTLLFPLPLPTSRLKTHLEENLNPNFETPLNSLGSEKVSRHMLIFCKLYTSKGKIPFLAFSLIMFAYAGSASCHAGKRWHRFRGANGRRRA